MAEIIYNLGPPYENDWTDPFEGGSDLSGDLFLVIDPTEGSFLLDGESDIGADPTVSFALEAELSGGSDIGADPTVSFTLEAGLSGGSDIEADPTVLLDPIEGVLLEGGSDIGAGPTLLFSLEAPLVGDSGISGSLTPLFDLDFSVVGESFLVANWDLLLGISSSLSEESHLLGDISWWAAPGAPPKRPSSNSAATLQQFIDATGVGRSAPRTAPTHSVVVDPNPPRKPQSPR